MQAGDRQPMWDTISEYIYSLIFGLIGLAIAGWLFATGRVIHSIDDLFLVIVALLFAVVCFGYLAWRVQFALAAADEEDNKKKPKRK